MLNIENELRSILGRRTAETGPRGRMVFGKIVKRKPFWPEVRNVGKYVFRGNHTLFLTDFCFADVMFNGVRLLGGRMSGSKPIAGRANFSMIHQL